MLLSGIEMFDIDIQLSTFVHTQHQNHPVLMQHLVAAGTV